MTAVRMPFGKYRNEPLNQVKVDPTMRLAG